jgi:hypothetical protein
MKSYHVFASAKPDRDIAEFERRMREFLDAQVAGNLLHAYRILRFDAAGSFNELPEYQVICDYASEDDLKKGFEAMRPDRWRQDPHAGMMASVGEFRVAFSEDVSRSDVR